MIILNKEDIKKKNGKYIYTPTYIYYNNNIPIGSFCIYGNEIWNVLIDIEYRNQGYGTLMIKELIQEVGSKKESLTLYVYQHNRIALKIYRKLGFVITERLIKEGARILEMKWYNPNFIRSY